MTKGEKWLDWWIVIAIVILIVIASGCRSDNLDNMHTYVAREIASVQVPDDVRSIEIRDVQDDAPPPHQEPVQSAKVTRCAVAPHVPRTRSWIDRIDLDSVIKNPWLIAAVFLLIQWFEIWYYNRTGKKSSSIDAAEDVLFPFMGRFHRWLYRQWRKLYFRWNPEKKDPDKEETKEDIKP